MAPPPRSEPMESLASESSTTVRTFNNERHGCTKQTSVGQRARLALRGGDGALAALFAGAKKKFLRRQWLGILAKSSWDPF